jgi:transketolase
MARQEEPFQAMTRDPSALAPMANAIRALAMDAVQAANSGHPGMPMGMADVATVLWTQFSSTIVAKMVRS